MASLPRPKNDYEIVVPEDMEQDIHEPMQTDDYIEDQADIDAASEEERRAISKIYIQLNAIIQDFDKLIVNSEIFYDLFIIANNCNLLVTLFLNLCRVISILYILK